MARFHVYGMKAGTAYALDVQSNMLDGLNTRVMIPLIDAANVSQVMMRLNPHILVNNKRYLLATERMAAVPVAEIGELITDLTCQGDEITAALDFLFQGF
jgi:toxin CcdB